VIDPKTAPVQSAVLVPVFRRDDGTLRLLVVRRGEKGLHGGQLAFPGGRCEPEDASPLATALREAREEVGIAPENVQILAALPPVDTVTTGFVIHPFLGRLQPPWRWQPQEGEIAEVLEVKVGDLTQPGVRGEGMEHFPTWPGPKRIAYLRIGPHRLWGATYRIVESLVPRLLAGEWPL
jgi:8-oxo-dGTP pyrophosphatase MutT (NUDIX family)